MGRLCLQVWDADGSDSSISTKGSLGDNDFDEFGLGDLTVRCRLSFAHIQLTTS